MLKGLILPSEVEISTDLGNSVALPHERCERLVEPVVVIRHYDERIFLVCDETVAAGTVIRSHLLDRPETHLALLGQISRLVGNETKREAMLAASTLVERLEVYSQVGDGLKGHAWQIEERT